MRPHGYRLGPRCNVCWKNIQARRRRIPKLGDPARLSQLKAIRVLITPQINRQVCTSADEGQTLGGCFHLSHGVRTTECVPHDATSSALKALIEDGLNGVPVDGAAGSLPHRRAHAESSVGAALETNGTSESGHQEPWVSGVGSVNVTASGVTNDEGGRCWNITFSSAIGFVGQMIASSSKLSGLGAAVSVKTLEAANQITGDFALHFLGRETVRISWDAPAVVVSNALLGIPAVKFARTTRTNEVADCLDGLCREGLGRGQTPSGGLEWTVELGTWVGNTEPSSPTATVGVTADDAGGAGLEEGIFEWPEAVSYLGGGGVKVEIRRGWSGSVDELSTAFNASQPFSIALGGVGASHGEI